MHYTVYLVVGWPTFNFMYVRCKVVLRSLRSCYFTLQTGGSRYYYDYYNSLPVRSGDRSGPGQNLNTSPLIRHWAYSDCRIENYPVNRCPADLTWLLESLPGLESVRTQPWTLNTALGWLCFSYWQARIHSVLPHMKQNRQEIWTKFPPLLFSRMLWGFVFH